MKYTIGTLLLVVAVASMGCGGDSPSDPQSDMNGADTTTTAPDATAQDATATPDSVATDSGAPDGAAALDTAAVEEDVLSAPSCESQGEVACLDEMILDLSLQDNKVSPGVIDNAPGDDTFATQVDATAGGMNAAAANPWVYGRFTTDGLIKVDLDDESALESTQWDIALKRFNIRLNSGVSGPGCVLGAELGTTLANTTTLDTTPLHAEAFYTEDCVLIEDGSGLPGAPKTVLSAWWTYSGCVQTTGKVFGIRGAEVDVALSVIGYYKTGQDGCDTAGTPGSGSGNLVLKWKVL